MREIGQESDSARRQYFDGKEKKISFSRLFQVDNHSLYIVGGLNEYVSLLTREYELSKCCHHINMQSKTLTVKQSMTCGRANHALGAVGKMLYSIGGFNFLTRTFVQACERYDMKKDRWEDLPSYCDL